MSKEKLQNCAGFVKSRIMGCLEKYVNPQDILDISEEVIPADAQFVVFLNGKGGVEHVALYNHHNPKQLIQRDSYDGDVTIRFYDKQIPQMEFEPGVYIQFRRFLSETTI